jgi:hypothetical protein
MKYFFDTEFIEDGKTIDLISIGIVAEDGREYYACNDECDLSKASDWVRKNVIVHLPSKHHGINPRNHNVSPSVRQDILTWKIRETIAAEITSFCLQTDKEIEFWAYYASYDWVAICQLWGRMLDLPESFPMYCRDLKQEADRLSVDLSKEIPTENEHHALADARWNKRAWEFLSRVC